MRGWLACLAGVAALGVTACGGGGERQDADEPSGTYPVDVVRASFPAKQRLADQSLFRLTVRNAGDKTIPNLATTIQTGDDDATGESTAAGNAQAFGEVSEQPGLADPSRPIWVLDAGPRGSVTAYTNTWAVGRIRPGDERTMTWRVTAVRSGVYTIRYEVAAGLDGRARAVLAGGTRRPTGQFTVDISGEPADARVDDRGRVVKREPR